MKLTKENLDILKSLSNVNSQIYFTSDVIRLASENSHIVCFYEWGGKVSIPKNTAGDAQDGFGINDIREILDILSLYKDPIIKEEKDQLVISQGRLKNVYRYIPKICINLPLEKEEFFKEKMDKAYSSFDLSKDDLALIKKQSNILKSPHLNFNGKNLISFDSKNTSCNTFTLEVKPSVDMENVYIKAENIDKIILDDYKVELNKQAIVFKSAHFPLTYISAIMVNNK